jgi:hypothetical protein
MLPFKIKLRIRIQQIWKLNRETLQGYRQISYDKDGNMNTIQIGQEANPYYKKPEKKIDMRIMLNLIVLLVVFFQCRDQSGSTQKNLNCIMLQAGKHTFHFARDEHEVVIKGTEQIAMLDTFFTFEMLGPTILPQINVWERGTTVEETATEEYFSINGIKFRMDSVYNINLSPESQILEAQNGWKLSSSGFRFKDKEYLACFVSPIVTNSHFEYHRPVLIESPAVDPKIYIMPELQAASNHACFNDFDNNGNLDYFCTGGPGDLFLYSFSDGSMVKDVKHFIKVKAIMGDDIIIDRDSSSWFGEGGKVCRFCLE